MTSSSTRQHRRHHLSGLLIGLVLALAPISSNDAYGGLYEEVGASLGVADLGDGVIALATGFLDLDLDGVNEAYFYSEKAIHYVDDTADGLALIEVTHNQPGDFVPEATSTSLPIDVDNDGTPELVIIGQGVHIYRIVAPGQVELMNNAPHVFPGSRRVSDAAAGDFNADGWPDIAVAMLRAGSASALQPGAPDMILMNRGGTFEAVDIEPIGKAMTQTLTLADIDLDGRVDIVESVNYSGVTGPSRILLNKTKAGADKPIFEVSPHTFDDESFGMGSAIEDINGDGVLDIFNTSVGRDYMMIGNADGSYTDKTSSLGFLHEWGQKSLRVQWSPSFADVDGDGDLDLFVRHGHLGEFQLFGIGTDVAEHNLLYVQGDDGRFTRAEVPFDKDVLVGGVDAVFGDVNGDGLPELSMGNSLGAWFGAGGGNNALPVDAFLWMNKAVPAPESHAVTLYLAPTISAHPPSGARIAATCDGVTVHRHFTHGGNLGAGVSAETFVGWKECTGAVSVMVTWPSGAVSQHTVEAGKHLSTLQEPEWWLLSQGADTWSLTLNTKASGGNTICFGKEDALGTCCNQEQGLCTFPYAPAIKDKLRVQIDAFQPQTLPNVVGRYTLTSSPIIPRPGEPFDIIVQRSGLPNTFDASAPWIRIDGAKIPWTTVDEDTQRFIATLDSPADVNSLNVQLLYKTKTLFQKEIPLGFNFDPARIDVTGYPTEHEVLVSNWELTLALSPDVKKTSFAPDAITVRDNQNNLVPSNATMVSESRVKISLSWPLVPPGSIVSIFDGDRKIVGPIPATRAPSVEDTLILTESVRGFLVRTSVVEGGDTNRVFFTLVDGLGFPLPPQPEILRVEVDGAEIMDGPMVLDKRPWETTIGLKSTSGVGTVNLRVYDTNDRLLGSWDYSKRASENLPCDLDRTNGELGHASIPAGVDATTSLKLMPRNIYGEMLGMDAQMEVRLPPYLEADPLGVSVGGFYETTLRTGDYGGDAIIEVLCNGELAFTLPLEVVGPPMPAIDTVEETDADTSSPEPVESETDVSTPAPVTDEGCHTGGTHKDTPTLVLLCMALVALFTRRRLHRTPTALRRE